MGQDQCRIGEVRSSSIELALPQTQVLLLPSNPGWSDDKLYFDSSDFGVCEHYPMV